VTDDTFVAAINIAGQPVDIKVSAPEVAFSRVIPLQPGQKQRRDQGRPISPENNFPQRSDYGRRDGPLVSFDAPWPCRAGPWRSAFDPSGVGLDADQRQGGTLFPQPTARSPSMRKVPAKGSTALRYECADALGNVTSGILPLDVLALNGTYDRSHFPLAAARPLSRSAMGCLDW